MTESAIGQWISDTGFVIGRYDPQNTSPVEDGMIEQSGQIEKAWTYDQYKALYNEAKEEHKKGRDEAAKKAQEAAKKAQEAADRAREAKPLGRAKRYALAATGTARKFPKTAAAGGLAALGLGGLVLNAATSDSRRYRPASMYYDDYLGKSLEDISKIITPEEASRRDRLRSERIESAQAAEAAGATSRVTKPDWLVQKEKAEAEAGASTTAAKQPRKRSPRNSLANANAANPAPAKRTAAKKATPSKRTTSSGAAKTPAATTPPRPNVFAPGFGATPPATPPAQPAPTPPTSGPNPNRSAGAKKGAQTKAAKKAKVAQEAADAARQAQKANAQWHEDLKTSRLSAVKAAIPGDIKALGGHARNIGDAAWKDDDTRKGAIKYAVKHGSKIAAGTAIPAAGLWARKQNEKRKARSGALRALGASNARVDALQNDIKAARKIGSRNLRIGAGLAGAGAVTAAAAPYIAHRQNRRRQSTWPGEVEKGVFSEAFKDTRKFLTNRYSHTTANKHKSGLSGMDLFASDVGAGIGKIRSKSRDAGEAGREFHSAMDEFRAGLHGRKSPKVTAPGTWGSMSRTQKVGLGALGVGGLVVGSKLAGPKPYPYQQQ